MRNYYTDSVYVFANTGLGIQPDSINSINDSNFNKGLNQLLDNRKHSNQTMLIVYIFKSESGKFLQMNIEVPLIKEYYSASIGNQYPVQLFNELATSVNITSLKDFDDLIIEVKKTLEK